MRSWLNGSSSLTSHEGIAVAIRTDLKTPPAHPHKHDHGLTQLTAALSGKSPVAHTHPEISALSVRIAALEAKLMAPPAPTGLTAKVSANTVVLSWGIVA